MTEKRKSLLLISLIIYSTLIGLLVAYGINLDESLYNATSTFSYASNDSHYFIGYFAALIIIYYLRSAALVIPFWLKNTKWQLITKVGLACSLIPEVFVIVAAFYLASSSGANCPGSGVFTNCGWGLAIFIPIVISTVLQAIGMLVGLAVSWYKK
jgi:hypothetical protein